MKKILFAAMAALAITGCSQSEEFESPAGKSEINFKSVVGKSVKAPEANDATLKTDGYKVYGYNTAAAAMSGSAALGTAFMDATATFTTSWALSGGPYYWPMADKIQFFAYSPATNVADYAAAATGYPTFSYKVQAGADQEDLLVAHAADKIKAGGDVTLTFKHVLTQVNFKLKGDKAGVDYSVTEIKIANALPEGTFTYAADKGAWAASGTTTDYVYDVTSPVTFSGVAEKVIATASNALMLMPQDVSAVKIEVSYTAAVSGTTTFTGTKSVTLTGNWEVGKKILYTLTLPSNAEEMNLVPSVGGWDAETETPQNPA